MIFFSIILAFILGWSLGKNNLGNLFGTAIGTQMIRFKTAVLCAMIFILMGALISSGGTSSSIAKVSQVSSSTDIIVIMISAIFVLELFSRYGIPVSIVQTNFGALIGWNFFTYTALDWDFVKQMTGAWIVAPILSCLICCGLMILVRYFLNHHPISLFIRDVFLRIGLVGLGVWASYTLGANNISIITTPYTFSFPKINLFLMTLFLSLSIGFGCKKANRRVISTIGQKLFPLSPTEALVVMGATALTMTCFSIQFLSDVLNSFHLPRFPLVPIPISIIMIGSICGISVSKGGKGLRFSVLSHIIISWFLTPVLTGGLCYLLLTFLNSGLIQ